jgi:hypothetical protein
MKRLLRVKEVGDLVGLTRQQIWKISSDIPGATMVGKQRRFDPTNPNFKQWVKHRRSVMKLKGAKRAPEWFSWLWELRSRVMNIDARYLDSHSIWLMAALVSDLYGRLLENNNEHLARELLRKISNMIATVNQRRGEYKRAMVLGNDGGSRPTMNGKPFYATPRAR